jgi:aquaporin Z
VDDDLEAFLDDSLEWRRLFSETWGTFLLVLVAAGAPVVGALPAGSGLSLPVKVIAPGVMVMAIIYFMGTVSGAHLNPSVTWAFALRGDFPWKRVPGYLAAQAVGGFAAAAFLAAVFGGIVNGATLPGEDITNVQAFLTELVLTLGLVSVILGTATGARNIGPNAALAVGGYIGIVAVWGAPISGASMNPMRSLAPAALAGEMSTYWIYLLAPLLGATVAVGFEFILRGKGGAGRTAAEGTLSPRNRSAD